MKYEWVKTERRFYYNEEHRYINIDGRICGRVNVINGDDSWEATVCDKFESPKILGRYIDINSAMIAVNNYFKEI